ncbi:MAG TPA: hypothetical protein VFK33_05115 [Bacillales bacterium]|nr:hypothetical protein [Bacillales bacterium]
MRSLSQLLSDAIAEKQGLERQRDEMETSILAVEQKIRKLLSDWIAELREKSGNYGFDQN